MVASLVLSALLAAFAAPPSTQESGRTEITLAVAGGRAELILNQHLLDDVGLWVPSLEVSDRDGFHSTVFEISSSHPGLELVGTSVSFAGLAGGALLLQGNLELAWNEGLLALSELELVPSTREGALFDLRTPEGSRLFYRKALIPNTHLARENTSFSIWTC